MPYTPFAKSPAPVTPPDAAAIATNCPFCRSNQVSTTSKTVSSSTYWRCQACGEIWNPSREQSANSFGRVRW
jgi:transposase-like protein